MHKIKFIVYLTTRVFAPDWMSSFCSLLQLLSSFFFSFFFHLPTGFCSSRAPINTRDAACGIGWGGGTEPVPEALRATGKECAREGETAACSEQGGRQEEIRTMSEMEGSRSHIFKWVCDDSSRKMSPDISRCCRVMTGGDKLYMSPLARLPAGTSWKHGFMVHKL